VGTAVRTGHLTFDSFGGLGFVFAEAALESELDVDVVRTVGFYKPRHVLNAYYPLSKIIMGNSNIRVIRGLGLVGTEQKGAVGFLSDLKANLTGKWV